MAFFVITCWDKPGALDERLRLRPDHVAYLTSQTSVEILVAGPQLDAEGQMRGSVFLVQAADRAAAEAFSAGDPFKQRGVFDKVDISGFTATMGTWVR